MTTFANVEKQLLCNDNVYKKAGGYPPLGALIVPNRLSPRTFRREHHGHKELRGAHKVELLRVNKVGGNEV